MNTRAGHIRTTDADGEADPAITPTASAEAAASGTTRSGTVVCGTNAYVDVVFDTVMESASYKITEAALVYTPVGNPTFAIAPATVSNKTASGFRQWFTGETTADFTFRYTCTP